MRKFKLITTLVIVLLAFTLMFTACAKKSPIDTFLDKTEKVVEKYEKLDFSDIDATEFLESTKSFVEKQAEHAENFTEKQLERFNNLMKRMEKSFTE
ncbi:MAG: hypothetical protein WC155_02305 [Candidatus Cloacimonadales bacterium]